MNSHIREGFVSLRFPSGILPPPAAPVIVYKGVQPCEWSLPWSLALSSHVLYPMSWLVAFISGSRKVLASSQRAAGDRKVFKGMWLTSTSAAGGLGIADSVEFFSSSLRLSLPLSRSFPQCPDLVRPWSPPYPSPSVQSLLWTHAGRLIATIAPNPSHFPKIVLTSS